MYKICFFLVGFLIISCGQPANRPSGNLKNPGSSWVAYGGDPGGQRYVALDQINLSNVRNLSIAWMYRTGEMGQNSSISEKLTFEATPIMFDGRLYLCTAYGKVIALKPATGEEVWTYDAKINRTKSFSELTSRGVSTWINEDLSETETCHKCIVFGTIDGRLIKLDAVSGSPCHDFGNQGIVDLHQDIYVPSPPDHQVTSPPAIINNLAIVGSSIGDNWQADIGSGVVRAYDLKTGQKIWSWDPLSPSREMFKGPVGAANAWSVISVDQERDLVFVPTGSASPDFYGGLRPGNNEFANSVVALRASSGEVVWHFQTVHHDLWDYDVAAQPALVDIRRQDKVTPAVVQATKTGNLFVLDRETGQPVYPVEEKPVPVSDIPGEYTSPTQPFSSLPNLMGLIPNQVDQLWAEEHTEKKNSLEFIEEARFEGIFTPPGMRGTILYPGNGSGINWGSVAFDPDNQLLVTNTCRYATYVELFPTEQYQEVSQNSPGFEVSRQSGTPYGMRRKTLISNGHLLNAPPWGTLAAVNLSTGLLEWEIELGKSDHQPYGLPNAGGPMVTKGGLIFIAATLDKKFRAYNLANGNMVWETELPRCGIATPMSYLDETGRQFVVIAAGGHGKMGTETGDFVVAFALPN